MYIVRRWWGQETVDLPESEFPHVIAELQNADEEHGDVCLKHESEWALIYSRTGRLVFENVEGGEPQHMNGLSTAKVVELWSRLAKGEISAISSEPWSPGYE